MQGRKKREREIDGTGIYVTSMPCIIDIGVLYHPSSVFGVDGTYHSRTVAAVNNLNMTTFYADHKP